MYLCFNLSRSINCFWLRLGLKCTCSLNRVQMEFWGGFNSSPIFLSVKQLLQHLQILSIISNWFWLRLGLKFPVLFFMGGKITPLLCTRQPWVLRQLLVFLFWTRDPVCTSQTLRGAYKPPILKAIWTCYG